ncbi:heptaprenyl diphosphate synthase [Paenibacillus uliginis N3/975]|uniref:Heptaprenyl diphosphate synthase n=1 Tax=Paenibacillus uliginis N3/975 TaxID=1313296 RepID=A0A1X7HQF4_9BACL|nr:polyprenyl synthetase family protein [Paenibacillus uliginis]SMF91094.1 heptaprenyl diphosphate synthase [Paenibacillus uliginis N3/975]
MKLHEALNVDINRVNREIEQIVKHDPDLSRSSVVAKSVLELIRSGGKRLRPLMVLVGSRFGPKSVGRKQWQLAAAAEFIHAASLVHDDVIDRSDLRRGQPAMHLKTGVSQAVHIGSYMSLRIVELLSQYASDQERYVHDLSSIASTQLCIGEYQQMAHAFDYDQTLEQYLEKSRNKTALLMATCLRTGALSSGCESQTADLLYEFGECLGMHFQIQDDLMDFTQDAATLGKPAGSDLRHGQVTLPVLFALQDPALSGMIRSIGPDSPDPDIEQVLEAIRQSGALEKTVEFSRSYLERANAIIGQLSGFPAHEDLKVLLHYFSAA